MQTELIIAISAGLMAMLGWGTSDFFAKKSVDKVGHIVALFWMQILGVIPLLVFFLFNSSFPEFTITLLVKVLVFGILDVLGYIMFYKALEKGKVSIIGPITASYSAFSVIIAYLFLNEKLTGQTVLILLLVFLGIVIASLDFKELKNKGIDKKDFSKGVPEALLGVAFFSLWFPFWDGFISSEGSNWLILLIMLRVVMSLFLLIQLKIKNEPIKVSDKSVFRWLAIIGLLDALAYVALTWGYGITSYTSIIIMLSATFSIPTLILARVFLKEKIQIPQMIGISIILIGIAVLAFVK